MCEEICLILILDLHDGMDNASEVLHRAKPVHGNKTRRRTAVTMNELIVNIFVSSYIHRNI